MKKIKQTKTELLAPAGSLESFFAAVESGADAVFCGLDQFSARAKAKNFNLQDFQQVRGYAGERGVKVYVALNTLIKEQELIALTEVLAELEYLSVDGLIIHDFGLYHIVRKYFPDIPLHASTQMLTHNLAGVLMLEKMGFRRAVLARELSLQEIATIGGQSSLELEHFVHGALCYSMSGQCLFSSYIDGRSGNRGRCIQPCRRRYHHDNEPGFYYSTSDFSAIELIPDLIRAGVTSFKIEGRMKSAEYVATVVSSYRMVIDAKGGQQKAVLAAALDNLKSAMGRSSSHGFLKGPANIDIVLPKQKGGIGKIVGRVERIQGKSIALRVNDVVYVGDRLRVQPGNDRAGRSFTVRTLQVSKQNVKRVDIGRFVSIPLPFKAHLSVGDLVFKLSTGKAFTLSEEACRRRLSTAPVRSHSVHLQIECKKETLCITAFCSGFNVEKIYPVEMFAAERSPLTEATLLKVFSSTGNPVLSLAKLCAENLPPVVIKPSRLKKIRREFYLFLFEKLQRAQKQKRKERLGEIQTEITGTADVNDHKDSETLYVVSDQIQDLGVVADSLDIQFIFPLHSKFVEAAIRKNQQNKNLLQQIVWDLPSIVFEKDWQELKALIQKLRKHGCTDFRLNNHAHFQLFADISNVNLFAGSWLYTINNQAMEATGHLGIEKWSFSIEDDKANIFNLLAGKKQNNLHLIVYSPVDLFTSRVQPTIQEDNFTLSSDKGEELSVVYSKGLTITRAEMPFSLIGRLQSLREKGCRNYVLDLRGVGLLSEVGKSIVKAFYEDAKLPGTTAFNFDRGLN